MCIYPSPTGRGGRGEGVVNTDDYNERRNSIRAIRAFSDSVR